MPWFHWFWSQLSAMVYSWVYYTGFSISSLFMTLKQLSLWYHHCCIAGTASFERKECNESFGTWHRPVVRMFFHNLTHHPHGSKHPSLKTFWLLRVVRNEQSQVKGKLPQIFWWLWPWVEVSVWEFVGFVLHMFNANFDCCKSPEKAHLTSVSINCSTFNIHFLLQL